MESLNIVDGWQIVIASKANMTLEKDLSVEKVHAFKCWNIA